MSLIKIICENYLPEQHTEPSSTLNDLVDIWLIDQTTFLPFLDQISASLTADEIVKSEKFHHLKDSQNFLVRRGLLRLLLARYLCLDPLEIVFITGENKKPILNKINAGIHFNTSHSYERILYAFSNTEVGVDVEYVREGFEYDEVLDFGFSKSEVFMIMNSPDPRRAFFKFWTRKEALLKASAKGLDNDLASIPSLDGTHEMSSELLGSDTSWNVSSFTSEKLYEVSIAHPIGLKSRLFQGSPDYFF